ncbi:MAG: lysoplasmalogenase [Deltaproteobacteria bacterium]|nr:lysoplasmalogenase [Deltaproteobacteria bacterium]
MLALSFVAMCMLCMAMVIVEGKKKLPRAIYATLKIMAATLFVAVGVARAGIESDASRLFVAALVLSWLGDVLLIPKGHKRVFLGGLVAFLLAHVMYVPAFIARGVDVTALIAAAVVTILPITVVLRWLRPKVTGTMGYAVVAYVFVISAMLATAFGCVVSGAHTNGGVTPVLFVGALVFYLSDVMVARERFVSPGYINRVFGIPLYFFAQLLLIAGFTS